MIKNMDAIEYIKAASKIADKIYFEDPTEKFNEWRISFGHKKGEPLRIELLQLPQDELNNKGKEIEITYEEFKTIKDSIELMWIDRDHYIDDDTGNIQVISTVKDNRCRPMLRFYSTINRCAYEDRIQTEIDQPLNDKGFVYYTIEYKQNNNI